ncbi:hydroxymethylbilane synthase [Rothia kristinae]|uniref:hydroxymethylbilane synthase n=1 Tax=Rothia kristinae TaxID=37923 RepID=UPI00244C5952|nr:hydroxymethylbilane synthase [Rothia kristinae]WGH10048.1 hydroxymethylbilane synthase [Rothia kristinae]
MSPEGAGTPLRVGTRGSKLATTQSQQVADLLAAHGVPAQLSIVTTTGDVTSGPLAQMGGTGVFAAALRQELLTGGVDLAVHSLKDLPTQDAFDGALALAHPPREDPRDALVARDGLTLEQLPAGAVIGTGSPRRAAQIRALRPECAIADVRGNVGTRLSRVRGLEHYGVTDIGVGRETRGDLDAVVLAASGLARLGLSAVVTDFLDPHRVLPAAGQGCLAVEYRTEDTAPEVLTALRALEDSATRVAVRAERALLLRLEAGCAAPVGAYAQLETDEAGAPVLVLEAVVADPRESGLQSSEGHSSGKQGPEILRETARTPLPAGFPGVDAATETPGARSGEVSGRVPGPEPLEQAERAAARLGTELAETLLGRGADRYTGAEAGRA